MNVLWCLTSLASAEAPFFTQNITIVSDQQEKPILAKAPMQELALVEIVGFLHPQPFRLDLQLTSMMVFGFHSHHITALAFFLLVSMVLQIFRWKRWLKQIIYGE
jgi:hypothetical protein